jgi:hypothetical protein
MLAAAFRSGWNAGEKGGQVTSGARDMNLRPVITGGVTGAVAERCRGRGPLQRTSSTSTPPRYGVSQDADAGEGQGSERGNLISRRPPRRSVERPGRSNESRFRVETTFAATTPSLSRTGCFGIRAAPCAGRRSSVVVVPASLSATRSARVFQTVRSAARWPFPQRETVSAETSSRSPNSDERNRPG